MNKFLQNIFILIIFFNPFPCIIVIPFQTYIIPEPEKFANHSDIFKYWNQNILYTTTLIGTPGQNITLLLTSQTFGSLMFYHMCDIPFSSYEKEKSSSYSFNKCINSYSTMKNASLIEETIYLYSDLDMKELKPYNPFIIIYSQNEKEIQGDSYEYHESTCMNVGMQMSWSNFNEQYSNLILQLKKNLNVIETRDFTFEYLTNTDGRIAIGSEPHLYDKEKYSELQYRISYAVNNEGINQRDFYLNFDRIFINKKNYNETISLVKSSKIVFDMGLVNAPKGYKDAIDIYFFNDLIRKGKCNEGETKDYIFYYCDKDVYDNEIKNNFPNLYFEMKQFHKIFELTYEELFRIKNDKVYFLIYFRHYTFGNSFELGKIFLQKYSFTYNSETKMIGYYNFDLPSGKDKEKKEEKSFFKNVYVWIGIITVVVIFGILGFFLGKKVYDKVRKKRVNEVADDNYDYNPQKNNEKDKLYDDSDE